MSQDEKLAPAAWRYRDSFTKPHEWDITFDAKEAEALAEAGEGYECEPLYDEATVRALSVQVEELRAALRPFAEIEPTNVYSGDPDDPDAEAATLLTENQFRRARGALKPEPVK